jgi:hypothetical protein
MFPSRSSSMPKGARRAPRSPRSNGPCGGSSAGAALCVLQVKATPLTAAGSEVISSSVSGGQPRRGSFRYSSAWSRIAGRAHRNSVCRCAGRSARTVLPSAGVVADTLCRSGPLPPRAPEVASNGLNIAGQVAWIAGTCGNCRWNSPSGRTQRQVSSHRTSVGQTRSSAVSER